MKARFLVLLSGVLLAAGGVGAASDFVRADDPQIVGSEGFLRAHPDLRFRKAGLEAYERKRFREAFGFFRDAARYADKTSQAMVAEMLWKGEGTTQDPPLAYAWMDLAAERNYPSLVVLRERYWSQLDARARERAIAVGQAVYDEFGDTAAKPRLENELARARLQVTGSRVGRVGTLAIPGTIDGVKKEDVPLDAGNFGHVTDGSKYYAAQYWEPQAYWKWQDAQWQRLDDGSVVVGVPQGVGKMN